MFVEREGCASGCGGTVKEPGGFHEAGDGRRENRTRARAATNHSPPKRAPVVVGLWPMRWVRTSMNRRSAGTSNGVV